jgi:hypothetical protein
MRQDSGRRWRVIAPGAVILAAGMMAACTPANIVGVETGAESGVPVFVVTDAAGYGATGWIYGLSVVPCGSDSSVWTIAATGSASPPSRIVYGQTPDGFVNRVGPLPLRPGCYQVYVSESAGARFRVARDGRVVADSARPQ